MFSSTLFDSFKSWSLKATSFSFGFFSLLLGFFTVLVFGGAFWFFLTFSYGFYPFEEFEATLGPESLSLLYERAPDTDCASSALEFSPFTKFTSSLFEVASRFCSLGACRSEIMVGFSGSTYSLTLLWAMEILNLIFFLISSSSSASMVISLVFFFDCY